MSSDSSENKLINIDGRFRPPITDQDVVTVRTKTLNHVDYNKEYLAITEDFSLRHGIELVNHRIHLTEYPTAVHEFMTRKMDKWIDRSLGDDIAMLGSTTLTYDAGHGKQADSSYIPRNLPDPSRHNQMKYRPGSQSPYPTFVFECAVSNENSNRLLDDTETKHFHVNTSIEVWLGLKVCLSQVQDGETFWIGWGRRKNIGYGLKLEEQVEDEYAVATYLPVSSPGNVPLTGQLTIPTHLIFQPLPRPANVPPNFVLSFENVRLAVIEGLQYM